MVTVLHAPQLRLLVGSRSCYLHGSLPLRFVTYAAQRARLHAYRIRLRYRFGSAVTTPHGCAFGCCTYTLLQVLVLFFCLVTQFLPCATYTLRAYTYGLHHAPHGCCAHVLRACLQVAAAQFTYTCLPLHLPVTHTVRVLHLPPTHLWISSGCCTRLLRFLCLHRCLLCNTYAFCLFYAAT